MTTSDESREHLTVMLANIPWAKLLTWGALLFVVYALQELFFVIFMTFLLSYIVYQLVLSLASRIRPGGASPALERGLTLVAFALILLLVWGVFSVLGSRFIDQSRTLLAQAQQVQGEEMLNSLLSRTVGAYLFKRSYGDPSDPRYQSALAAFQAQDRHQEEATIALAQRQQDFEEQQRGQLAQQWWLADPMAVSLRAHLRQDAGEVAQAITARVEEIMLHFVAVPAQILTALLLSVFITLDMAGLKRGAAKLRASRCRGVYNEVAPGLVIFARLVGRAFSAQALVALFNTLFTFILLWSLGVKNELLLCGIVFFTSFIPVLGVFIAGVPITLQAILQPGGSIELALFTVAGIVLIHLIEATLLSPRIVGKVLHLHPVLVIVVIVVGEHLFGIWGLLLGVPVAVYIIHVAVLNEAIPGIYEPGANQKSEQHQIGETET